MAVSRLVPIDLGIQFKVILGGGDETELNIASVTLLGLLPDSELQSLYSTASFGLLPYFGLPAEGPKVKALEFFSAGLLVISSLEGVDGIDGLIPWTHYVPADSVRDMPIELSSALRILTEVRSLREMVKSMCDATTRGQRFLPDTRLSFEESPDINILGIRETAVTTSPALANPNLDNQTL